MKTIFVTIALLVAFAMPAVAQWARRLSPDDRHEFDKYYTKWVNDTRKNDRDDIAKDVGHMQEIMARNNIPADVPFDQIASSAMAYQDRNYRGRLSAGDQKEFDKHYAKWIEATRKNDRDDMRKEERHIREIMGRNNIPPDVPFDQISSGAAYPSGAYPSNASPTYTPPSNAYPVYQRLSSDDQREFDRYYAEWLTDNRANSREDVDKDAQHMQDIMSRNNIPANVPFDQIASPDAAMHH